MILGAGGIENTDDMGAAACVCPELNPGLTTPFIVSNWKLSDAEIKYIQETGSIWISVMGGSIPPIMVMGFNPFENEFMKPLEI